MRKVAGEADKLRQLGKLIQRLRRPGIVYCATVRAVDELYVALRHGKIPVERYNGKMTTDEREKSQASFMQPGRKVVMLATNAFGLGIDKPDIRYIIHYQMPGSPESYVQEAGRAGRDGKPARCVLLFQPDDIAIQEHFLKEAHPTKSQARMVAEGLYAWSDEGKEVSVRDLALSMALPERRVRVILSVLEAMGVAEEVKAARWKGVEPKPTREQIDKAAIGVRGAANLGSAAAGVAAVVHEHAEAAACRCCAATSASPRATSAGCAIRTPGLDSEVFDPGSADERHGLHAATDFHARPRRRRRGRGAGAGSADAMQRRGAAPPPAPVFETAIPSDVLPPLPAFEVPPPPDSEQTFDEGLWAAADAGAGERDGRATRSSTWRSTTPARLRRSGGGGRRGRRDRRRCGGRRPTDFDAGWAAVRDANIRPYAEWRAGAPVTLPVLVARPLRPAVSQGDHAGHHGGGGHGGGGAARGHRHAHGGGSGGPGGRFDGGGGGRPAAAAEAEARAQPRPRQQPRQRQARSSPAPRSRARSPAARRLQSGRRLDRSGPPIAGPPPAATSPKPRRRLGRR